ncbi:MAG: hypothetical protein ACI8P9_001668 [Parasphingorhabdus sp.]|jgi:hypothetical protein
MSKDIIFWLVMITMLAAAVFMPQVLMRRAVPKVLAIFREHNAVGKDNAKSRKDLDLAPALFFQRKVGVKDYKPRALTLLVNMEVVKLNEDGNVYLCEIGLAKTIWNNL